MRLRTQLVLAFLVLAVVPLATIVLYSYTSSERAFRRAVEEENRALATAMGERMTTMRRDMSQLVTELGSLPVKLLLGTAGEGDRGEVYEQLIARLGEVADFVEYFELTPTTALQPDSSPVVGSTDGPLPAGESIFIFPSEALANALRKIERYRRRGPAAMAEIRASMEATLRDAIRLQSDLEPAELEALRASAERSRRILGTVFRSPVGDEDNPLGYLRIQVRPESLLRWVLERTHRDEGEIPYALDGEGSVHVAEVEDRDRLGQAVPLVAPGRSSLRTRLGDDWMAVETQDSDSGIVFGIARPIRRSLSDMRSTAMRNFGAGVAVVALALLAVALLSARLTRDLRIVTAGAERLATGDMTARVPELRGAELGQLARTFNRMAFELSEKERRLLDEERRRKEQEIQQRLLAAENASRRRELEAARALQIALLPRRLPQLSDVAIAARMDTASEVGGDFYDVLEHAGGVTVAIGDATGHGARAGTMVALVKGLLSVAGGEESLARLLGRANAFLNGMGLDRMSMALALLRIRGSSLSYAAAGMPPLLLYRCHNRAVEETLLPGVPLGAMPGSAYEEWRTEVGSGDGILLMSDGLPELLDSTGEPLGYVRARDLYQATATAPPEDVVTYLATEANRWRGEIPQSDDLTLLALRLGARPGIRTAPLSDMAGGGNATQHSRS